MSWLEGLAESDWRDFHSDSEVQNIARSAHELLKEQEEADWNNVSFNPQGWQCPVCGAVYSPTTPACFNCTGWKVSNRNDTKTGYAIFDLTINESVTKAEKPQEVGEVNV